MTASHDPALTARLFRMEQARRQTQHQLGMIDRQITRRMSAITPQLMSIYTSNWDSDNFWKNVTLQLRLLRPESQLRCNVSLAMRMLPLFPKRASRIRCFHR